MTDFAGKVREANKLGWFLLNCFQIPDGFRVNLQMRKPNGASTEFFTEYADAETPDDALDAAIKNARARAPHIKQREAPPEKAPRFRGKETLTSKQEETLERHVKNLFFAVKQRNGSTGRNNRDDDL